MLIPAGVPSSFVTSGNSPGLSVGFSVYDNSGSSPALVHGPMLMTNFVGNSYQAKWTPPVGNFVSFIAVYTDNTLTALLNGYEEQVEALTAIAMAFNAPVNSVIGYVDADAEVEGVVNC